MPKAAPKTNRTQRLARIAVHVIGLTPLLLLIYDGHFHRLTENPLQELTLRTGKFALIFLVASLAVTPMVTVFGWRWLTPQRRTLGLYAFLYASLHVLTFAWLDYNLDFSLIVPEVAEKNFILVGFAAFLILVALASTSSKGWQRRLGKRWKKLHKWVYVAGILVIVHFTWQVKSDVREPLLFGALVVLLLALRRPAARAWIAAKRSARAAAAVKAKPAEQASPEG